MMIENLPNDILIEISTYLQQYDVQNLSVCCKSLYNNISNLNEIWYEFYINTWNESKHFINYKEKCIENLKKFGKNVLIDNKYSRLSKVWSNLLNWYKNNMPYIYESLVEPICYDEWKEKYDELEINDAYLDIWLSYLFCGGQNNNSYQESPGMFGCVHFYDTSYQFHLVNFQIFSTYPTELMLKTIMVDLTCNIRAFIARDGRILRIYRIKNNNPQTILMSPSFLDFLEEFWLNLSTGQYRYHQLTYIDRFLKLDPLGSRTVTNGIQISVSVIHVPESGDRRLFTYQVAIEYVGDDRNFDARLTEREWFIQNFEDNEKVNIENIRGPGVIGLYPIIKYNKKEFLYESCTNLGHNCSRGKMWGAFYFINNQTGDTIRARIDPFQLIFGMNSM